MELYKHGMWQLAALVLLFTIALPLLRILGLLYILIPLRLNRQLPHSAWTYHTLEFIRPWSMLEIFLFGILVTLVKIVKLATIVLGISFWSLVALIIAITAASALLDPHTLWDKLESRG